MEKDISLCDCDIIHDDVVKFVSENMLSENKLYNLSDFFKMFGDNTRVKIMWALDKSEMCVCDLAALLNMTKSAISHQLRSLKSANLVKFRRQGNFSYYSLADDHIKTILEVGLEHINE